MSLSLVEIVGYVVLGFAVLVGIMALVSAVLSPRGRDGFVALGLRLADALTALLERLLSQQGQQARAVARGVKPPD